MPIEQAVINSSPFILLSKCDLLGILPKLFPKILMPDSVFGEILVGNDEAATIATELAGKWLTKIPVVAASEVATWNLGDGEAEVLSYALSNRPDCIALLDDRAARRCAETLGIPTLGTAGLLVVAKRLGAIDLVGPKLNSLKQAGLYLSDEIRHLILKQAGETD